MAQKETSWRDNIAKYISWNKNSRSFTFISNNTKYKFDIKREKTKKINKLTNDEIKRLRPRHIASKPIIVSGREIKKPARGHQYRTEVSPNKKWFAICDHSYNLILESTDGKNKIQITKNGSNKHRYGYANWTYGEELGVRHSIWWTPDSKKVIYYVFSEKNVKDFHLTFDNTKTYTKVWSEGYIKAGEENPIVHMEIYDLESGKRTPIDVGQKIRPDQYIYNMFFAPGGEFIFSRTDRLQRELDIMTANLETGTTRTIVSEKQDCFQNNKPIMHFLNDNKRFIWESEKTKWKHFELRNIDGSFINGLTKGDFPVKRIINVDEKRNTLYFSATSDQTRGNHLNTHLHKVNLDGSKQKKITQKALNHSSFKFSPDNSHFTTRYESVNASPSVALYSSTGNFVKVITEGDNNNNNTQSELFTFLASDGVTVLYGKLNKPINFDKTKNYPMILTLYGGPDGTDVHNRYSKQLSQFNKLGYFTCVFSYRGGSGRGKKFLDMGYEKLGDIDIQDQSDGCRFLAKRPYIDAKRIGIIGHSYGGFMAAMGAVKHSDIFAAAVDRAGPTHWKHYDSIYTERYMNTPQNNPQGYRNGSVFAHLSKMDCPILIQHGLQDDNVHPTNAWHFVDELNKAKKFYELQIFPYGTHGFGGYDRAIEFFNRHLLN